MLWFLTDVILKLKNNIWHLLLGTILSIWISHNQPEMQKNQFVELENGRSTDTQIGLKPYFLMYKSNLCESVPFPLFV